MQIRVRYCDVCNCNREVVIKERLTEYTFRKETFQLTESYAECLVCNNDVTDEELDSLTLKKLSKLYEMKHSINAEVIKEIRHFFGITQTLFAKLLNRGIASIKRYEGGTSLPDTALISILKMLKDNPSSIMQLYKQNFSVFDKQESILLEKKFNELFPKKDLTNSTYQILSLLYKEYENSIYNGNIDFNYKKLFDMILYFSKEGVLKTKLMKLLWYSDFLYYKKRERSISGTPYCHLPFGPVPKNHDLILGCMESLKLIKITEEDTIEGYTRILIKSEKYFTEENFIENEKDTLEFVQNYFESFGSRAISEYAHCESAWIETKDFEIIPYSFALDLKIN